MLPEEMMTCWASACLSIVAALSVVFTGLSAPLGAGYSGWTCGCSRLGLRLIEPASDAKSGVLADRTDGIAPP
jgi:hypothetical protein